MLELSPVETTHRSYHLCIDTNQYAANYMEDMLAFVFGIDIHDGHGTNWFSEIAPEDHMALQWACGSEGIVDCARIVKSMGTGQGHPDTMSAGIVYVPMTAMPTNEQLAMVYDRAGMFGIRWAQHQPWRSPIRVLGVRVIEQSTIHRETERVFVPDASPLVVL